VHYRTGINQRADHFFEKEGITLRFLHNQFTQARGQVFNFEQIANQLRTVRVRKRSELYLGVAISVIARAELAQACRRRVRSVGSGR